MRISEKSLGALALAGMLVLAVLPLPYGYYQILRIAVSLGSLIFAALTWDKHRTTAYVLVGTAVLFNPIIPIYLTRDIWFPINLACAVLMLVTAWKVRGSTDEPAVSEPTTSPPPPTATNRPPSYVPTPTKISTQIYKKREVVLDTETTGLSPAGGDRVVEIGCVELINHVPTGLHFHIYLNPERDMPQEAFRVHGLSEEFLRAKPKFAEEADAFLDFIGDATLVIHNAPFDIGFLNAELQLSGRPRLTNAVIDTVMMARAKHPGVRVSLDTLCRLYDIDNSRRTLHGALLDSEILAEVYLKLIKGAARERSLLN